MLQFKKRNIIIKFKKNIMDGLTKQTQYLEFFIHKDFFLSIDSWGEAQLQDIVKLLDSTTMEFYSNLETNKLPNKLVFVLNSSLNIHPIDYTQIIILNDRALIFLHVSGRLWSRYSYQFSHELCHYVIDMEFPPKNDKFGWLEESICELASLYTLNKMSITWKTNPPYSNWIDYSNSLSDYVNEIITDQKNTLNISFYEWLDDNISELILDRYKRDKNKIIALQLLPLFIKIPELWKTIQYLKDVIVKDEITLRQYLYEWKKVIPSTLQSNFVEIINIFIEK